MRKRTFAAAAIAASILLAAPALRAQDECVGDCNEDNLVPINELILVVNIAGGRAPLTACSPGVIDVDTSGSADINELVMAVVSSLSACGDVPLPTSTPTPSPTVMVAQSPTPTMTTGPAVCGNGTVEGDEECDDGAICVGASTRVACTSQAGCGAGQTCRASSGDGCASNCTNERRREANLDPCTTPLQLTGLCEGGSTPNASCDTDDQCSGGTCRHRQCAGANLSAQFAINVELPLSGTQVLTTGFARDNPWVGLDGVEQDPLKIPIVIRASDVNFNPINVFNLFCACVVPVPEQMFGIGLDENENEVGISGSGFLGCNEEGLTDIDFLIEQDHNTTPGDPGNSGSANGLPDDPECDDVLDIGDGFTSSACMEGEGDACDADNFVHGVCNSPRRFTFSGGPAGRGSVLLRNQTALKLLAGPPPRPGIPTDNACTPRPETVPCPAPEFGPDCMPCTDDDQPGDEPVANNTPTTSGVAEVTIYDFRNAQPGKPEFGPGITMEHRSLLCPPRPIPGCVNRAQGAPADCDALLANPDAPLSGTLVTAFPGFDTNQTGDAVTTTTLATGDN